MNRPVPLLFLHVGACVLGGGFLGGAVAGFVDCNENGIDDAIDIQSGASSDCNLNGIPDECEVTFDLVEHSYDAAQIRAVLAADLDGDADSDLVTAKSVFSPDRIAWYENLDGLGGFGPRNDISLAVDDPWSLAAADLDGDGDLDVASGARGDPRVSWYENLDAQGTFGSATLVAGGADPGEAILAGDIDGDGDDDIVAAEGSVVWYENLDGLGMFGSSQVISVQSSGVDRIHLSDVDGDGDLDLFVATGGDILWIENTGQGGFGSTHTVSGINGIDILLVSDLDRDGDPDVLAWWSIFTGPVGGSPQTNLAWFENEDGRGSFVLAEIIDAGPTADYSVGPALGTVDVDGDGDLDLPSSLRVSGVSTLGWYENTDGLGTYGGFSGLGFPGVSATTFDVDRDGDFDLLSRTSSSWFENTSDDCNGNGLPDICDLPVGDCDASGALDSCEITLGVAADCNLNDQIDECDITVGTSDDCNGNGVPDECDVAVMDCNRNGVPDPCDTGCFDRQGCDMDGDRCQDDLDCAPTDPAAWSEPTPASGMQLSQDGSTTALDWEAPGDPGGSSASYDTLRSVAASDFDAAAICLETDGADTTSYDTATPVANETFYYLVGARNGCPGARSLGFDSAGNARTGRSCP